MSGGNGAAGSNSMEHSMAQHGIHHVTAIAGSARRNLDFHTRVLGLRLVKKTSISTIRRLIISITETRPGGRAQS